MTSVPRTIWMLWLQGLDNAPPLVKSCIDSWEQMNPGWELRVLSREDLPGYFDLDTLTGGSVNDLSPQHLSDLIRINLLERYGGCWADATCLCMVPLDDWIHEHARSGFFAFSKPGPDRLMSNWFLAARRGCPLVSRLCRNVNSYCKANDFTEAGKRTSRYARGIARRCNNPWFFALYASPLFARLVGYTPYYWFHYTFAYTLLRSSVARRIWKETPKVSSDGPHAIQRHGMFEIISDSLAARISAQEDPVYKLDWRESAKHDLALSDVDSQRAVTHASQEAGVRPTTD